MNRRQTRQASRMQIRRLYDHAGPAERRAILRGLRSGAAIRRRLEGRG
ncbi:MAG TPA: hypothetical protein P5279_13250 [Anaerohalosphaeraceae bacterium]|jgi:hypothetical protein|nr:hypothetical protein [Anaerohalosphaeraceae bacterium]HRT51456.1 hypothetical protein [Anaerohalosphaeraceae bacterium]HRT87503.1 hypothetical protein [Anaerohalosphaeraceae bacterium]